MSKKKTRPRSSRQNRKAAKQGKVEVLTYKEIRERQRQLEVSNLAPGSYIGNESTFGAKDSRKVSISPSKKYFPKREINPGPGEYDPSKGEKFTMPKVIDVRIEKPMKLYQSPPENLPGPGTYSKETITFGKDHKSF